MVRNPLLKYSIERLLNEANPQGKTFFGATAFNKMIFLLYRQLRERENINIKLPYYWYLQGSLFEEKQLEIDVGHSREYYITTDRSTRKMTTVPPTIIPSNEKIAIDHTITELVATYRQHGGYFKHGFLDLLLDDVYERAPYDFQREFNRKFMPFLNSFLTPKQRKIPAGLSFTEENLEKIEISLDSCIKVFPNDDMERIYETYLEWDDTARIALQHDPKKIFPISESVWKMFCKNLRILQNENISDDTIHEWDSLFSLKVFPEYQEHLHKLRLTFLKKWKRGQEEDTEIDRLVTKMNLISRNNLSAS